MTPRFRFKIMAYEPLNINPLFSFNLTEVNDPNFVVKETKEKGKFYYVKSIESTLNVINSDYQFFRDNIDSCYLYRVYVYKKCNNEWVLIERCYFNNTDITFDFDKCSASIKLQSDNAYDALLKKKGEKVDVYGGASQTANLGLSISPTLYRSMPFIEAILMILSNIQPCTEFVCYDAITSDFFDWTDDGFGGTDYPDNQTSTNYVNTLQPNYYLRIVAKSDALNPSASNPATSLKLSFDDIERIMEDFFNVYWVIENDRIRFEHYSWFTRFVNYNSLSATNFPLNKLMNKIEFDKTNMPTVEQFRAMEMHSIDFIGTPIKYSEYCTSGDTKERGYELCATDVPALNNGQWGNDLEGFLLVDCYKPNPMISQWLAYSYTTYIVVASQYNGRLAWSSLHYDLHRHGRVVITGEMNGSAETFLSIYPNKLQENIKCEICCKDEFEKWESAVKTEISDGMIQESTMDYVKDLITFKVRHERIPKT
jgi:hypothetical protein